MTTPNVDCQYNIVRQIGQYRSALNRRVNRQLSRLEGKYFEYCRQDILNHKSSILFLIISIRYCIQTFEKLLASSEKRSDSENETDLHLNTIKNQYIPQIPTSWDLNIYICIYS